MENTGTPVHFGIAALAAYLKDAAPSQVAVLTDENTRRCCLPLLSFLPEDALILSLPAGESSKSFQKLEQIVEEMAQSRADRNALLIALGGGMITDLGGFAASIYKRGIRCVLAPTSLLAMVDATLGGKTGINAAGIKNIAGVFRDPDFVCIEPVFLDTLPQRELHSAYAEIIKHGLIADREYAMEALAGAFSSDRMKIIRRSLEIKLDFVQRDPLEKNVRKALNFGHTVGHAIEAWSHRTSSPLLHGEAVAAGMICEIWMSMKRNLLSAEDHLFIEEHLLKLFPRVPIPPDALQDILTRMENDKKNLSGTLNCTLLTGIGSCAINQYITSELAEEALRRYSTL